MSSRSLPALSALLLACTAVVRGGLLSSPLGYYQGILEAAALTTETQLLLDAPAHDVAAEHDPASDLVPDSLEPKLYVQAEGDESFLEHAVPVGYGQNRSRVGSRGQLAPSNGTHPPAGHLLNHGVSENLDTDDQPFLLIAKLSYSDPTTGCRIASAFMAEEFQMLTSGHNVFNLCRGEWRNQFRVGLAQTDRVWPLRDDVTVNTIPDFARIDYPQGVMRLSAKWSIPEWIDQATCCCASSEADYDWGMLTLDRPMGERVGWMGQDDDKPDDLTLTAYPNSAALGADGSRQQTRTDQVDDYNRRSIEIGADTGGGDCGGPWYARLNNGLYDARGIHVGTSGSTAWANRLVSARWDDFFFVVDDDNANRPPDRKPQVIEDVRDGISTKGLSSSTVPRGADYDATLPYFNAGFASSGGIDTTFVYVQYVFNAAVTTCRTPSFDVVTTAIDTHSRGGLSAGSSATITKTLTAPWAAGTYLIGAVWSTDTAQYTTDTNIALIGELTVVDPSCEGITTCDACTRTDGCGWCKRTGQCVELENEPVDPGDIMFRPLKCFNPGTGLPDPLILVWWECSCCFEQTSCGDCHAVPDEACCWHIDHCDISPVENRGTCSSPDNNACQEQFQWVPSFVWEVFWPWWRITTTKPFQTIDWTPFDPNPPDWEDPIPSHQPPVVFVPPKTAEYAGFLEATHKLYFRVPTAHQLHSDEKRASQIRNFLIRYKSVMKGRLCLSYATFDANFMVCVDQFLRRVEFMDAKHAYLGESPIAKIPRRFNNRNKLILRLQVDYKGGTVSVGLGRTFVMTQQPFSRSRIYKEEAQFREPTAMVIVEAESGVFQIEHMKMGLSYSGKFPFRLNEHLGDPQQGGGSASGGVSGGIPQFIALKNGATLNKARGALPFDRSSIGIQLDDDSLLLPVVHFQFKTRINKTETPSDDSDLRIQLRFGGNKFIPDFRFKVEISGVSAGYFVGRYGNESLASGTVTPGSIDNSMWRVKLDRQYSTLALFQNGNEVIPDTQFASAAGGPSGLMLLQDDDADSSTPLPDAQVSFVRRGGAPTTIVQLDTQDIQILNSCPVPSSQTITLGADSQTLSRGGDAGDCLSWRVAVQLPGGAWDDVVGGPNVGDAEPSTSISGFGNFGICYHARLTGVGNQQLSNDLYFVYGVGEVATCDFPFQLSYTGSSASGSSLTRGGAVGDCVAIQYEWLNPNGNYWRREIVTAGAELTQHPELRSGVCYRASVVHIRYRATDGHNVLAGYACDEQAATAPSGVPLPPLSNYVYFHAGGSQVPVCTEGRQLLFKLPDAPVDFAIHRGGGEGDCVSCKWDVMLPDRQSWQARMSRNCKLNTRSDFGLWGMCYRAYIASSSVNVNQGSDVDNGYGCMPDGQVGHQLTPFLYFQKGNGIFGDTKCDYPVLLGLNAAGELVRGGEVGDCMKLVFARWDAANGEYDPVDNIHAAGSTTITYGQPGDCFRVFLVTTNEADGAQTAGGYGCGASGETRVSAWYHYSPGETEFRAHCRDVDGLWLRSEGSGVVWGEEADLGLFRAAPEAGVGPRLRLVGDDLEIGTTAILAALQDINQRLAVLEGNL